VHPIPRAELRRLTVVGVIALAVLVAYWTLWGLDRPVVATSTDRNYLDFEQAFPVADAWLGLTVLLAVQAARRRRPVALLWLLAGGGAGVYLFCMDVTWDLQHGTYATGAGGLIELAINLLTLGSSVWILSWAWRRRTALLSGPASTTVLEDQHR
jgi:hypothetical protein